MEEVFYTKTATVWNRYTDGLMEKDVWLPTVIKNVRILVSRGNNIMKSGNQSADSARMHIHDVYSNPSKPFLSPSSWNTLVISEKDKFYTLDDKNDSFFTIEDTSFENSSGKNDFFGYMKKKYSDCYKITSVDRFEIIPHREVWGK